MIYMPIIAMIRGVAGAAFAYCKKRGWMDEAEHMHQEWYIKNQGYYADPILAGVIFISVFVGKKTEILLRK